MSDRHPDHDHEQNYVLAARQALNASISHVETLFATAKADKNNPDAQALAANLSRRARRLRDGAAQAACFARIDDEDDEVLYIGRQHIAEADQTPLVIDWRASAAEPFYRATPLNTMGCERRRQFVLEGDTLLEIYDTDLTDPEAGAGIPDPLLAEINRARTGSMREIVATIQGEQDRIVRAPLDRTLVVQGGPGTGKTAVGLHRVAYLLFEHREVLRRDGVLVVGPNRRFLEYISDVLPSLGERSARQIVPTDLGDIELPVAPDLPADHRRLAGDLRMARLLRLQLELIPVPPTEDTRIRSDLGSATVRAERAAAHMADVLAESERFGSARELWMSRLIAEMREQLMERSDGGPVPTASEFASAVRKSPTFKAYVKEHWRDVKPQPAVRTLWRDSIKDGRLLAKAGFSDDDIALLRQRPARMKLSEIDRPLIDEASWQLGQRYVEYGHVVLDEAQDLSPMALRMVARRARNRSFTVLGDVAQCTGDWMYESWDEPLRALATEDTPVELTELTVGYRVPAEFIVLANALLPSIAPGLSATGSVRPANAAPGLASTALDELVETACEHVAEWEDRWASAAIIDADSERRAQLAAAVGGSVDVLSPAEAKGLEFDAVLVVEPAAMADPQGGGWRPLFVALTRAVQHLDVLHAAELPGPLAEAFAGQ